jgi:hypothetical protein
LKQGEALSPLLSTFALECAIRRVQANQDGLKLNGACQLIIYTDDINIWSRRAHTIKNNTETLLVGSKKIDLEVNADKTKHVVMSRDQNERRNHNVKIDFNSLERVEEFKYLETTLTNQNSVQKEIKGTLKSGNSCYHSYQSMQNILSSSVPPKNLKIETYSTIILSVVFYGCETWSLTLRKERRLRVFENRVLRRVFGPKRDEVTAEWRKLRTEEFSGLYSSENIIWMIKSRR